MKIKHDKKADAIYIYLNNKSYAYGKDLDDERRIDYAVDNIPVGIELLNVSKGVKIEGLPLVEEIADALESRGIKIYQLKPNS
ncbi:MAG: hypothetical protein A2137_00755 [Chloroflexi bacterium RBG_16_58_8]|nr:MAG: hypothetical protein A2137_00755 [Chloroflexi bacterium RBG_16_58_8]